MVTNSHVVEGADRVEVVGADGQLLMTTRHAEALSTSVDLAVLPRLAEPPGTLAVGRAELPVGTSVLVIGAPAGLTNTVSEGIVSAYRLLDGQRFMQMSAPISHGSSGGPLLDRTGAVVGVSTATWNEGQNLNFAVTAADLRAVVNSPPGRVPFPPARLAERRAADTPPAVPSPAPRGGTSGGVFDLLPAEPAHRQRYNHIEYRLHGCARYQTGVVICALRVENLDETGRANTRLILESADLVEPAGAKVTAEDALLGSTQAVIRGWANELRAQVPRGGVYPMLLGFVGVGRSAASATLYVKARIGQLGSAVEVSFPAVPITNAF